jgi:hypothetical protein
MIMDGLDTLTQVALADQLSFGVFNPPASTASDACAGPSASQTATTALPTSASGMSAAGLFLDDDNLNTPVTTSSDVNFNFGCADFDLTQEPFPITGECWSFHSFHVQCMQSADRLQCAIRVLVLHSNACIMHCIARL